MLYPKLTQTRNLINLSGLWNFKADRQDEGMLWRWQETGLKDYELMPVPASYNDITTDQSLKEFIGDVWYEKYIVVPESWKGEKLLIRVGSASHHSKIWVNGALVKEYTGGFLPFEADISEAVFYGKENHVAICVNNELNWQTLPPGEVFYYEDANGNKIKKQKQQHDFYNYSGIHRPVYLYTKPQTCIDDITVYTDYEKTTGIIKYEVDTDADFQTVVIEIYDQDKRCVAIHQGKSGQILIKNVHLWNPGDPYLYELKAKIVNGEKVIDIYSLNVGVRTVKVESCRFYINHQPFYFKGFGKHEDMDIKGKGMDDAVNVRDFNLLKWMQANSFRTSHYPYSEEILDLADRYGIVVIGEVPAVGLLGQAVPAVGELDGVFREDKVNAETLKEHMRFTTEMIMRDKNHPCVVMWSLANEASVMEIKAATYFETLVNHTRKLDDRPLTNVNLMLINPGECQVSKYFDVIGLNLYFGWYSERGDISSGGARLRSWLEDWYKAEQKPIFIAEYGVDTVAGLHKQPAIMFTEEFQVEFLKQYHEVFDKLSFVIGEHVWNFADFMTGQDIVRVDGNKKGVFTRQRQPKMAAHYLRERWSTMDNDFKGVMDGRSNK